VRAFTMISEPDSTLTSTIAILKLVFPCIAIYTRVEIKTRLTMLVVNVK